MSLPIASDVKGAKMSVFSPLRVVPYRRYFYGQIISMAGTAMQSMVQGWLVYSITQSSFWLGVIVCCQQGVSFLCSPWAGTLADRSDRRRLFVAVELAGMMQALTLGILVVMGWHRLWNIAALSVVLGVINALELTLRHALVADFVGPNELAPGIALNSITLNTARVLGPSLAGAMFSLWPEQWMTASFFVNAVSYLFVAGWVFSTIRWPSLAPQIKRPTQSLGQEFFQACRAIATNTHIKTLLVASAFISFVCFPYQSLLPVYVKQYLRGDPDTMTLLLGAAGCGAICGSALASRGGPGSALIRRLGAQISVLGLCLAVLGLGHQTVLITCAAFVIGLCLNGAYPAINAAIQRDSEPSMRGRVLSLYTMSFLGAIPLGSLAGGFLGDRIGSQNVMLLAGSISIVFGTLMFWRAGTADQDLPKSSFAAE